ncbi:site-2 protease family protein [archaeon]|nr:site-2 protease family protein [archaeon]
MGDIISFITTNLDYSLMVFFGIFLAIILLANKKKVELQKIVFPLLYLILYKTSWGLKKMDSIAKKLKKYRNALSYTSITLGFLGMVTMLVLFLFSVYKYFFVEQEAVVAPLLPGASIPGLPELSFVHWIIAIFVLATVHEFSHGIFARMYDIKVKSSGFAFFGILLPIIPAAFVEPDEKEMEKASKKEKLAVLSAGTFSNFIFAGIFLAILALVLAPLSAPLAEEQGVIIVDVNELGPSFEAGVQPQEIITSLNGIEITNINDLVRELNKTKPYEKIELTTESNTYTITLEEHPEGKEYGYLGVNLAVKAGIKQDLLDKYGSFPIKALLWINILVYWLFLTNFMVGLVNLLPIGIVDGGLMFNIALGTVVKNKKIAKRIFNTVSIILLLLLLFFLIPALFGYFMAPFQ